MFTAVEMFAVYFSAVFICTGALGTPPAERGPALESIYRVSSTQYTRLSKTLPVL